MRKRRSVGRRAINWLLTGDRTATRRTVSSVSAITAAMMLSRARALSVSARIVRACAPRNETCETANAASATLTARALLLLRQFIISYHAHRSYVDVVTLTASSVAATQPVCPERLPTAWPTKMALACQTQRVWHSAPVTAMLCATTQKRWHSRMR